jgi:hypothetical protein
VQLRPEHKPTGFTKHYEGSELLPSPSSLAIAKHSDDSGYYLLYYDETGTELTDTYHDSLEEALHQAILEFQVKPEEWSASS